MTRDYIVKEQIKIMVFYYQLFFQKITIATVIHYLAIDYLVLIFLSDISVIVLLRFCLYLSSTLKFVAIANAFAKLFDQCG